MFDGVLNTPLLLFCRKVIPKIYKKKSQKKMFVEQFTLINSIVEGMNCFLRCIACDLQ